MATIADCDLPRRREYPWNEIFNGKPWKFVDGEDFDSIRAFRALCYKKAKDYGVKVRTKMSGDWRWIIVQSDPSDLSWRD